MLLPTDGLWRGAMNAFQDPSALALFGDDGGDAFPFLSAAPLTSTSLAWAALCTAFLAGPTLAGETESGIALAVLSPPIRRPAFLLGKWLRLVAFGSGFVVVAGSAQCLVVRATVDYWPPGPGTPLALLAAQTVALLTLAVLLSTAISPMASGVVAVGLFGTAWVPGAQRRPTRPPVGRTPSRSAGGAAA